MLHGTRTPAGGARPTPALLSALFLSVLLAGAAADESPARAGALDFLVLKTGEPGADPAKAGGFLTQWGDYLSARVRAGGGADPGPVHGTITAEPAAALAAVAARRFAWGIVTPAFLLDHGAALGLKPLLQTRRNGRAAERFVVVTRKGAAAGKPAGFWKARVMTLLTREADYVRRAIFEDAAGAVTLEAVTNLADAVYAVIEDDEAKDAAVLLDAAGADFFRADELSWPKLEVLFESQELPPDVVVGFAANLPAETETALRAALGGMRADEEGKRICRNLQTDGFGPVDEALWARARKLYHPDEGERR
ncbi:MAG: PhnD/SsuA/transferrin family substrate-binding protein [Planctomycetes bacterium]|nr:PhnD/SsuA/transferrin family substrate-binding protein [Planctomycetota bacterium]